MEVVPCLNKRQELYEFITTLRNLETRFRAIDPRQKSRREKKTHIITFTKIIGRRVKVTLGDLNSRRKKISILIIMCATKIRKYTNKILKTTQ